VESVGLKVGELISCKYSVSWFSGVDTSVSELNHTQVAVNAHAQLNKQFMEARIRHLEAHNIK